MKPAPFAYHAPRSREALLALLAEHDDTRLLAGGQSLVPLLNLRLAAPAHLIDLNRVPGLDGIAVQDGQLRIGAMTRQRAAERSPLVAQVCPLLTAALQHVGWQQTRNRGTIGGSLAHMDPTAELPVVASAADAVLQLETAAGSRSLPFAAWPAGYLATAIGPGEVLTRIDIPCWPAGHGWAFLEMTRRGESAAIVAVAAQIACDGAGRVVRAAIAVGGLAAAPQRAVAAEAALVDGRGDVAGLGAADLVCEGDLYAPADFKRHLAGVLIGRAVARALARAMRHG